MPVKASRSSHITVWVRTPECHRIRDWVGPKYYVVAVDSEIFLFSSFSPPQFHWPLPRRLVSSYRVVRAPFYMSSWNISRFHLSHNLLLTRVGLCSFTNRVLACRRLLISDNHGHNHISPSWVCSGESDTGTSPPLHINSVCPTQYHSTTDVCFRLTHQSQKLNNLMFIDVFLLLCLWHLSSVFVTLWHLFGVEASSVV